MVTYGAAEAEVLPLLMVSPTNPSPQKKEQRVSAGFFKQMIAVSITNGKKEGKAFLVFPSLLFNP